MSFRVFTLGLLAFWLCAGAAHAADPTPAELAVGRRLFVEATELEGRSEWQAAREKLEQAVAIKETPGLRFHLGYCSEQLGKYVAALVEYDRAVELIAAGQKAPDVERSLGPARERVKSKVAKLTVRLPADVASPQVRMDGAELAPAQVGQAAPIDPGSHRIEVAAPDFETAVVDLDLSPGESRVVDVVLSRKAPPAAPVAAPSASSPQPQPNAGKPAGRPIAARGPELDASGLSTKDLVLISEGTLAVAGLAVGLGFLVVQSDAEDRVSAAQAALDAVSGQDDSACASAGRPSACDDLQRAIDDYDRAGTLSTIGFVAAGVGAAAAAVTYVVWPSEKGQALVVQPASAGLGLSARGQF